MPDLLVGWVAQLRGARGELAVASRSEDLSRYLGIREARFARPGQAPEARALESVRTHGRRLIIKPAGVDSAAAAAAWIGLEMRVPSDALPPLAPGSWYAFELLGLEVVTRGGERLGRLCDVRSTGGCDLWVVRSAEGRERLIPAAASICTQVDTRLGRITVDPPEGLLELDAI
jgi:16S rRNA processing protein RimM